MAREQWKKIGIVSGLITLGLSVLVLAAAGGGKAMAFEKDIATNAKTSSLEIQAVKDEARAERKVVSDNQSEDRSSIKEIAGLVKALQDKTNEDYKELKQENHDNEVRDEKTAAQYGLILTHMTQQTDIGNRQDASINAINVSLGKVQTKVETLITDE